MDATTLRTEFFKKHINCFGLSYIFSNRAIRFTRWVNLLKVFGIAVPALIGAAALSYEYTTLRFFIYIATPVTIVQFIFSVFAVIYKWDDELSYCFESSQHHTDMYSSYKKLFYSDIEGDVKESERQLDLLEKEYLFRVSQDTKHNLRDWEMRKGLRYSLREHQHVCIACEKIPKSMQSTDCDVCGKFNFEYKYIPFYERLFRKSKVPV